MGFFGPLFFLFASLPIIFAQDITKAVVVVDGTNNTAETDDYFICATLDWWPPEKCDYNQCPWGNASILNLDLDNPLFAKAVKAFTHLRIRIGGSLQDKVTYEVENSRYPCEQFIKMKDGLFGFSNGCLPMKRWEALNLFFTKTGALITFSLNALFGRHPTGGRPWAGDWDSSNAYDFIKHTVSKGYEIDSWELGNELSGDGVGASIAAEPYGKDMIRLGDIISELYKDSGSKPTIIAPGGFYDKKWFAKLLQVSGSGVIDVVTHHIYNLGAGVDPNLINRILDPNYLSQVASTFDGLQQTVKQNGPWASIWVGESGGAYNSGGRQLSNTFVNGFWYLDQLGMSAKYHTKVYCRQSLIGGNYGLLNTTTFAPNPDYYSALLWHQLMGKEVLAVQSEASPYLRVYAHCAKGRAGVTILVINMSNKTDFSVEVRNSMNLNIQVIRDAETGFFNSLKKWVWWVGKQALDGGVTREEYHLTPKDGYLRTQTVLLNGKPLEVTENGDIPRLDPLLVDVESPLHLHPLSISFFVLPHFDAPVCA